MPEQSLKVTSAVEKVQFVPYGFTTLRLNCLPVAYRADL
jgi:hypothetical protein